MLNLVSLTSSLIAGILLGYFLRDKRQINLGKVTFGVILALIFSLGFSISSNDELLGSLPKVGLNAFVILFLAVFLSVVFLKATRKLVKLE